MAHICMVHWYYPPQRGGVETLLQNVCEELVKRDHKVTVLAAHMPGCPEKERRDCVLVHRTKLLPSRPTNLTTKTCIDLQNFLDEFLDGVDIAHLHNFHTPQFSYQTLSLYLAARAKNVKPFLHLHGRPLLPLDKFLVSQIPWSRVIAISEWLKDRILETGIPPERVTVVYNGVDIHRFRPNIGGKMRKKLGVETEKVIFCPSRILSTTEGKIQERKNLFTLLEAASLLKRNFKNFRLLFTAIGSELFAKETYEARDLMREKARTFGIEENIMLNEFSFEEMPHTYAASDLVALPSIDEPFGIVYVEGMASSKPVIGMRSGAAPEVIQDGQTGYLANPGDPRDLADKMLDLLSDERKAKEFGKNGRRLVEKKFSIERIVSELEGVYLDA
ncbi:MAG: glycosyltransferase family 4 protein [Methanocellales archaeon]|nr:glycosyltransferase family 4 protein [Methanocellales archaeon]